MTCMTVVELEERNLVARTTKLKEHLQELTTICEFINGPKGPGLKKRELPPTCALDKISDQTDDCLALAGVLRSQLDSIKLYLSGDDKTTTSCDYDSLVKTLENSE